jgi:CelD/BcsL family acetyltransferase involved in cellulose biosynthesis
MKRKLRIDTEASAPLAPVHDEQTVNITRQIARPGTPVLPIFALGFRKDIGEADVADIVDLSKVRRASVGDATIARVPTEARPAAEPTLTPLTSVDFGAWRSLAERAIEPNGYYLPDWELAVNATAPGRTDASALSAWRDGRLIGLMPVVALSRVSQIPLPALASAHPYGTLCTPLLDGDKAEDAAIGLMQAARDAGTRALLLREVALDGAAMKAFGSVLRGEGLRSRVLSWHPRASLDATRDADELLHEALSGKKLKELRRQRHRLAEHGDVRFDVARSPEAVASALETFLKLEASGWKGQRGTALVQVDGDAAFIRRATKALAELGQCEIVTLFAGDAPVASGIVLRHQTRAFFFKIGVDARFAKYSPGVQLTLDLTRHLCADPAIASADSTASPGHPMINPIWRGRFAIGDMLIPLKPNDPVVALIHAALVARQTARNAARGLLHLVGNRS